MNKYIIILPIISFVILFVLSGIFGKSEGTDKLD